MHKSIGKIIKISFAAVMSVSLLASYAVPAFAKDASQSDQLRELKTKIIEKIKIDASRASELQKEVKKEASKVADLRKDLKENRCTESTTRISNLTTRYNKNKENNVKQYQEVKQKVTAIIQKLTAEGLDTTKLKADLQTLDLKITKSNSDYTVFVDALNNTKQFICGSSNGQYIEATKKARQAFEQVRLDSLDIRKFYLTTIKTDVQAIRKYKASAKPTSTASASATTN